jgi:hypothetical protein
MFYFKSYRYNFNNFHSLPITLLPHLLSLSLPLTPSFPYRHPSSPSILLKIKNICAKNVELGRNNSAKIICQFSYGFHAICTGRAAIKRQIVVLVALFRGVV